MQPPTSISEGRASMEALFLQRRVVTVSTKIPGTDALPATATMAFRWIDRDGIYISVIRKRESIFLLPGTLFRRIWTTTNVGMVLAIPGLLESQEGLKDLQHISYPRGKISKYGGFY